MQCETDNLEIEVSSITQDAVESIALLCQKTKEEIAGFLLEQGFSNLAGTGGLSS